MKYVFSLVVLGFSFSAFSMDVIGAPSSPVVYAPLKVEGQIQMAPYFDFGNCVAKTAMGCRRSGYPGCTEWAVTLCRESLPAGFADCFTNLEESCRQDRLPNCPEFAAAQCRK